MKIQINTIKANSLVDGPGDRVVLFTQGCPLACPGCQNRHLWDPTGGRQEDIFQVALSLATLARRSGNVTISGGEPFAQPGSLALLVLRLRLLGVKNIIVYSGFTWDELHAEGHPARAWLAEILDNIDVLVDGRFVFALDDALITYRGSRNQRPIDVLASLRAGRVVTLDWDNPEVVIDGEGNLVLPIGLAESFKEIGPAAASRMCGQTR